MRRDTSGAGQWISNDRGTKWIGDAHYGDFSAHGAEQRPARAHRVCKIERDGVRECEHAGRESALEQGECEPIQCW
jgi:hypothetical protein